MTELWIPGAIRKPIPAGSNDPTIVPIGDVFHIAVSNADTMYDFYQRAGGIESTGYIRYDGTIEQYRPFNVECDAQNDGNSFLRNGRLCGFNSWESEGFGDGQWTTQQIDAIKKIILFKHEHLGTPLVQAPAWNAPGFGYHRLFDRWNTNRHSCPGDARVAQWNNEIIPWMKEVNDVALSDDDVQKILDTKINHLNGPWGEERTIRAILRTLYNLAVPSDSGK